MSKLPSPSGSNLRLAELARAADALVADKRRDMAVDVIDLLYYFADRRQETCEVIPFPAGERAVRGFRAIPVPAAPFG